jgi:opacity protein-like surface antigen
MYRVRVGLLAGVSALAIAAVQPKIALAADLPARPAMVTKAPPATFRDRWSWWVEGGANALAGDPGVAGLIGFDVDAKQWGWEAAIGFEYRPSMSPWIWSAQFRYGQHGNGSASNNPVAVFQGNLTTPVIAGSNSANRKEHHWLADFMVGRDLGLGQGQQVAKFGVRVAEIRGKTTGSARWNNVPVSAIASCTGTPSYCGSEVRDYTQTNQFLGVGPRLELSGAIPLGEAWSLDYMAGVAGLYGRRKVNQNVAISNPTVPTFTGPAVLVSGGPIGVSSSSNGFVFNLDAMLGFSYAITQNASLMVSYRFDGYWNALRGYDSNGNVENLNRFYHGPMVRFTLTN